jgi:hypothetical protein
VTDLRVLVTGSRDWNWPAVIEVDVTRLWWYAHRAGRRLLLVHGDCPTGADRIVRDFVEAHPRAVAAGQIAQEPYPADWSTGKSAGPHRNRHMVSLGADLCLAYPRGESGGTRGCAGYAWKAGIPTLLTEWESAGLTTLEFRLGAAGIRYLEEL